MDVLTDVLKTVRLTSSCWGRMELSAPWGIEYRAGAEVSMFFYIHRGSGWLTVGENWASPVPLTAGDLVVAALDRPVTFRDDPATTPMPIESLIGHHGADEEPVDPEKIPLIRRPVVTVHGGGGRLTTIISGVFHFKERQVNPLLSSLPSVIHIRSEDGRAPAGIGETLKLIAQESTNPSPGTEAAIDLLADLLFIQTLRTFMSGSRCEVEQEECGRIGGNWLRALAEPQIASALALIHAQPGHDWTVASLASAVSMSRSAFATRFTASVGEPPLAYLTRWRLLRAAGAMRDGERMVSLAEIAADAGYESEAAFNKAFKRMFGQPPGAFRRAHLEAARAELTS